MPVSDSARKVRLGIKKVHFMVKKRTLAAQVSTMKQIVDSSLLLP